MLIKSRNFSPTKCENTFEKDGFGWAPGQEKRYKCRVNKIRYNKNFSRGQGTCLKCDKFKGKKAKVGEHCSLPANEHCQK